MPTPAPVDRIIRNTEAKLTENPGDIELRYQLARVNYLAYSLKTTALGVNARSEPTAADVSKRFQVKGAEGTALAPAEAAAHAATAARLFEDVLTKDPKHALAHLGLASLLQEYANERPKDGPKEMAGYTTADIRKHFTAAFEAAWVSEKDEKRVGLDGLKGFVSHEAAEGYLATWKNDPAKPTEEESKTMLKMEAAIKQLQTLGRGPITPLIFSLKPASSIASLLAPERSVRFDLRGFGAAESWPWLQPDTGILVWDPANEGRVTSARQMLGSYSWQLFWRTGFDALTALDDNRDGWLRDAELDGLGLWQDKNQNAVSESGEVASLSSLGVTGLACTAPEAEGPHPLHRHGVEMKDGSRLPLWDWTTRPLPTGSVATR